MAAVVSLDDRLAAALRCDRFAMTADARKTFDEDILRGADTIQEGYERGIAVERERDRLQRLVDKEDPVDRRLRNLEIVDSPRPETAEEEDLLLLRMYRGALDRIDRAVSRVIPRPGSPSLLTLPEAVEELVTLSDLAVAAGWTKT